MGDTCVTAAPGGGFCSCLSLRLRASVVSPGFGFEIGELTVRRLKVKELQVEKNFLLCWIGVTELT
jgi:hypothetical protein